MPLYDYTCVKCDKTQEVLIYSSTVEVIPCNKARCKGYAEREFPAPAKILCSETRSHRINFDPVIGEKIDKEEQKDLKRKPWPRTSDHARKYGLVGKVD